MTNFVTLCSYHLELSLEKASFSRLQWPFFSGYTSTRYGSGSDEGEGEAKGDTRSRPSKQRASLRPLWTIGECARAPSKAEAEGFDNCLPGITTLQGSRNNALNLLMLIVLSWGFSFQKDVFRHLGVVRS